MAETVLPNLADLARQLRAWAIDKALPLWSSAGYDSKRGGFHERLHPDGSPDIAAPRRLRVQTRQIYVYAHAAALGWFPQGRQMMLDAVEFLLTNYRAADGGPGYVFSLAPDNSVADGRRDTYDHMFVLLALAWAARASGDAQIRSHLDDALNFIDQQLTAPDGSFFEGWPRTLPRRQNPHMHAFEAMLALHETLAHPQAMQRARRLLDLMQQKFLDRSTATIGEYFTDQWTPAPGAQGDIVEPGHHAEWAWLLRRHERFSGAASGPLASQLLNSALRWTDATTGLLIDQAERRGPARSNSRRLWPQTELAKAWIAETEAERSEAAQHAAAALRAIMENYLDRPLAGAWTEQFDLGGRPLTAGIAATSLYHVFGAIAEADRILATHNAANNGAEQGILPGNNEIIAG